MKEKLDCISILSPIAAAEAIQTISRFGDCLTGWLLSFNLWDMTFRKIRIQPRAGCVTCDPR